MLHVTNLDDLDRQAARAPEQTFALDLRPKLVGLDPSSRAAYVRELDAHASMARVRSLHLSDLHLSLEPLIGVLAKSAWLAGLVELHLDGDALTNEDIVTLSACPHLGALRTLNLNGNQLSDPGLEALAQAAFFPALKALDVGVNWIQCAGLEALLAVRTSNLEDLVLGPNMALVGDEGAIAIAESGWLGRLRHLDLSNNQIGDVGVAALLRSEAFALTSLTLCNDEDVFYMDCRSGARNTVGDRGAQALSASQRARSLRALYLRGNPIGEAGLSALRDSAMLGSLVECDVLGLGD